MNLKGDSYLKAVRENVAKKQGIRDYKKAAAQRTQAAVDKTHEEAQVSRLLQSPKVDE